MAAGAGWIVGVAATLTAVGVIARLLRRPVRWLAWRVVGEPLTLWFRAEVGQIVDERLDARPLTNGWGTRAVAAIAEATGAEVEHPHRD